MLKTIKQNILYLLMVPIVAAILPYLAADMFDTPDQGFCSLDILLLLLLFTIPKYSLIWNGVWLLVLFLIAFFYENTFLLTCGFIRLNQWSDFYTFFFFSFVAILLNVVADKKRIRLITFVILSTVFFLIDWSHLFLVSFNMTLIELFNISKFFIWGVLLFIFVPVLQIFLTTMFARNYLVSNINKKNTAVYILFLLIVLLFNWLLASVSYGRVQFLDFSTKSYFSLFDGDEFITKQHYLQEDVKKAFPVYSDSAFKTPLIEYEKIVVILAESWGVSKNVELDHKLFDIFLKDNNVKLYGLMERKAAFTKAAEWEDFGVSNNQNVLTVLQKYQQAGYETWYVHGYDSAFFYRDSIYPGIGFDSLLYRNDFIRKGLASCKYGYPGICDSSIAAWLPSLLKRPQKQFVYWTSLDAHYPYNTQIFDERSPLCDEFSLSKYECVFYTHQERTLKAIAKLTKDFPEVKFYVRGDHRPMATLGTEDMTAKFYHGWVSALTIN